MTMRRLRMGLNTILGIRKEGFFIPYRYADSLPKAGARGPYKAIEAAMKAREDAIKSLLDELSAYRAEFEDFKALPAPEPRWEQDWFPRLDAAMAYLMVRKEKPKRIVEVGSGHSTRFMARAIRDGGLDTHFTAIDPAPRAPIESLPIEVVRKTLHDAPEVPFDALRAGDFLFIDSSHIAMPGSDVDLLFLDILPRLPTGVFVHIHDIFLPHDYPESWDWRGYNEQQATAPLFLGGGYELVFSSCYVGRYMKAALEASAVRDLPLPDGAYETSLWLQKKAITPI
ncbi:MAG: class I SAM-dependent methyltransferase [Alphaproteobacteria bacterium]|nr:MAG: class I SAM-dependent methyltransferase [Alphaproteobacteria bacterium]